MYNILPKYSEPSDFCIAQNFSWSFKAPYLETVFSDLYTEVFKKKIEETQIMAPSNLAPFPLSRQLVQACFYLLYKGKRKRDFRWDTECIC